jgi:DNA-binding NarL/FixJ family response regulator
VKAADGTLISVVLSDDHTLIREAISEMIEADEEMCVVGQAANCTEAAALAREKRPDVLLLGIEMPATDAGEVVAAVARASAETKLVVLTARDDARLARELLARGASGYLTKSASSGELISAVKSLAAVDDRVVLSLSRGALEDLAREERAGLSGRELEHLQLVARGMSNKQLASSLRLTEGTVKRHLHRIYKKLGVSCRVEAVLKGHSEGLVEFRRP